MLMSCDAQTVVHIEEAKSSVSYAYNDKAQLR